MTDAPISTKRRINVTTDLPHQTDYTLALNGEYSHIAFDEMRVLANKGKWRSDVFKKDESVPMDLEVGTGNGTHFAYYAQKNPNRLLVGLELKYKPLIQTIRRADKAGCRNAAVARFHAFNLTDIFVPGELDNVFIHFPDPWTSPKKPKNRFVQKLNLDILFDLQKPGSIIEFKTDSLVYFDWAMDEIRQSKYNILFETRDLHNSPIKAENFETAFEKIFLREGILINFVRLQKPHQ
ncbi:tRNA (guanine-N7)-methyltransferase [Bdellovibrio sp. SKB1291214]|uniref:tRNA (guanine(46)-N(7))-methyltransferase TrmB n=1 Tax=Bdellovibrio sp. SKB1291214 TaxID=1732569 RepID=UPI001595FD18|nr:tRNA (guanine-N7)-methyltransferase [Bdellovibrio sp. SKB1291214]UYL10234.1 tRNA (guanine-N7)-methyltransferase [Bdellovibrio sp. SKB1291214]